MERNKCGNRYSLGMRERAVRVVLEHNGELDSNSATIKSIALILVVGRILCVRDVRREMLEIVGKRRRFGYRRIGVLLERKGVIVNHKKSYRLYWDEGLSVKRRRSRKRADDPPVFTGDYWGRSIKGIIALYFLQLGRGIQVR